MKLAGLPSGLKNCDWMGGGPEPCLQSTGAQRGCTSSARVTKRDSGEPADSMAHAASAKKALRNLAAPVNAFFFCLVHGTFEYAALDGRYCRRFARFGDCPWVPALILESLPPRKPLTGGNSVRKFIKYRYARAASTARAHLARPSLARELGGSCALANFLNCRAG